MDAQTSGDRKQPGVTCGRAVAVWPADLRRTLDTVVANGYGAAELAVSTLHCILNGKVVEAQVERIAGTCAAFADRLAFSVHSPAVLDLRDQGEPDLHRDILLGCVRFAGAIRAKVLVVHYEARSDDARVEAQYRAAIEAAAEVAGRYEVILGIENIEVERTERVLEFLEGFKHPWVRMTYDFAHDYLAGDLFGYDHLQSAAAAAAYAAHLHLTDNFGRFNQARFGDFNLYRLTPFANKAITGVGDLHLPLGWGTLPAAEVYGKFAARGYQGLLI
ncbi:MAG: sugar phosphate isomerase/epimerase family protein, partial [Chloroflexota bacterium]